MTLDQFTHSHGTTLEKPLSTQRRKTTFDDSIFPTHRSSNSSLCLLASIRR
ncbi:hypothetical protein ABKV19_016146 [Rosa sericea]